MEKLPNEILKMIFTDTNYNTVVKINKRFNRIAKILNCSITIDLSKITIDQVNKFNLGQFSKIKFICTEERKDIVDLRNLVRATLLHIKYTKTVCFELCLCMNQKKEREKILNSRKLKDVPKLMFYDLIFMTSSYFKELKNIFFIFNGCCFENDKSKYIYDIQHFGFGFEAEELCKKNKLIILNKVDKSFLIFHKNKFLLMKTGQPNTTSASYFRKIL